MNSYFELRDDQKKMVITQRNCNLYPRHVIGNICGQPQIFPIMLNFIVVPLSYLISDPM